MALWDIKGKAFRTPVYNLLGGKSRDAVLVYGHANGRDVEETGAEVAKYISLGYKAIRAQTGIPGLPSTYGVAKDKMYYEPAEKRLPPENSWSTEKYLLHIPKLFESLRVKFGDEIHLLTIVHSGGITHLKKVASLAELYHVRTGCHGAADLSPVSMAAALHFDMAINNFGIQEYMIHTKETDEVFPHAYSFKDGFLYPGDGPGFGVDYDESLAARFPYQRAYLPVNRKEDGTIFNW